MKHYIALIVVLLMPLSSMVPPSFAELFDVDASAAHAYGEHDAVGHEATSEQHSHCQISGSCGFMLFGIVIEPTIAGLAAVTPRSKPYKVGISKPPRVPVPRPPIG